MLSIVRRALSEEGLMGAYVSEKVFALCAFDGASSRYCWGKYGFMFKAQLGAEAEFNRWVRSLVECSVEGYGVTLCVDVGVGSSGSYFLAEDIADPNVKEAVLLWRQARERSLHEGITKATRAAANKILPDLKKVVMKQIKKHSKEYHGQ